MKVMPTVWRLILPAAEEYASVSAGDIVNAPAMLSNPCVESSDGRNFDASTSSASRSRITLLYSTRLSRWMPGGIRFVAEWLSSCPSIQVMSASRVVGSGRGMPVGGIIPARSFHDFFAKFRTIGEVREIQLVEQEVRRLQFLVVADDAILIEDGTLFGDVRSGSNRRGGRLLGCSDRPRDNPATGATGRPPGPRSLACHKR